MSFPSAEEVHQLAKPYLSHYDENTLCIKHEGVVFLAQYLALPLKAVLMGLLEKDIWPLRFYRNKGVFTAAQMIHLLSQRVFLAGCGGLGGYVAQLMTRMGVGAFRLCDPDVFEESNINRQCFCTEKTLGQLKVEVCRQNLLDIASYLDVEAYALAAAPHTLPRLLTDVDLVVDCLDSVPRKKMLEQAAEETGIPFLHGSVLQNEGFAFFSSSSSSSFSPSVRLSSLYPDIQAGNASSGGQSTSVCAVAGVAGLMVALFGKSLSPAFPQNSHLLHLDCSIPELEQFDF